MGNNFRVRCVRGFECFTEGKIYEVKDGIITTDYGTSSNRIFENVEELNSIFVSKFELVEEDKIAPLKYILDYYDLKIDEVFLLNGIKVFINKAGMLLNEDGTPTKGLLTHLIMDTGDVKKLPWKPKGGNEVYVIYVNGSIVKTVFNDKCSSYLARLKLGWLFKTKEEAEANKNRVLKEMKEVLES